MVLDEGLDLVKGLALEERRGLQDLLFFNGILVRVEADVEFALHQVCFELLLVSIVVVGQGHLNPDRAGHNDRGLPYASGTFAPS